MLLIGKVASSNNIPPNTDNNYLHRLHDAIVGSDASQAEISACRATSFRSRACDDVAEDGEGGRRGTCSSHLQCADSQSSTIGLMLPRKWFTKSEVSKVIIFI